MFGMKKKESKVRKPNPIPDIISNVEKSIIKSNRIKRQRESLEKSAVIMIDGEEFVLRLSPRWGTEVEKHHQWNVSLHQRGSKRAQEVFPNYGLALEYFNNLLKVHKKKIKTQSFSNTLVCVQ